MNDLCFFFARRDSTFYLALMDIVIWCCLFVVYIFIHANKPSSARGKCPAHPVCLSHPPSMLCHLVRLPAFSLGPVFCLADQIILDASMRFPGFHDFRAASSSCDLLSKPLPLRFCLTVSLTSLLSLQRLTPSELDPTCCVGLYARIFHVIFSEFILFVRRSFRQANSPDYAIFL